LHNGHSKFPRPSRRDHQKTQVVTTGSGEGGEVERAGVGGGKEGGGEGTVETGKILLPGIRDTAKHLGMKT